MSQFTAYLTGEVVEDYSDGMIDRRDALRRLGLLGVTAPTALGLLAACGPVGGDASQDQGDAAQAGPMALPTEAVIFAGPDGRELQGSWAAAAEPRGAVLVVHENRGLTDHIRSVSGRLAASGFAALAIDLLSEEGGTESFADEGEVTAALNQVPDGRFVADMKAGVDELIRRSAGAGIGAVGFCFGGGMVWTLLAAGEPRLAAAAPFYGPLPASADFTGARNTAVLGIYAEQDDRVNASRAAAGEALQRAGVRHEIVTYPDAGHAFFNDTGQRYQPAAAAAAYEKLIGWFAEHLR